MGLPVSEQPGHRSWRMTGYFSCLAFLSHLLVGKLGAYCSVRVKSSPSRQSTFRPGDLMFRLDWALHLGKGLPQKAGLTLSQTRDRWAIQFFSEIPVPSRILIPCAGLQLCSQSVSLLFRKVLLFRFFFLSLPKHASLNTLGFVSVKPPPHYAAARWPRVCPLCQLQWCLSHCSAVGDTAARAILIKESV